VKPEVARRLLWCGLAAPIVFAAFAAVESALRPGYSQMADVISDLGVGPYWYLQTLNFFLTGMLIVAFAFGLRFALGRSGRAARTAPRLVGAAGVALFLAGVFPESLDKPLSDGGTFTLYPSLGHVLVSLAAFLCLIAAAFCVGWAQRKDARYGRFGWFSLVFGFLSILTLQLMSLPQDVSGLGQRIFLGTVFLWMMVLAAKAHAVTGRPAVPAPAAGAVVVLKGPARQ
jgi:hypothetical membrane protein